jgi:hypothetical protein
MEEKELEELIKRLEVGEKKIIELADEVGWEDERVKSFESHFLTLLHKSSQIYNKMNKHKQERLF